MAQDLRFSNTPTQAEIQNIIAKAHQMRSDETARMFRMLKTALIALFTSRRGVSRTAG